MAKSTRFAGWVALQLCVPVALYLAIGLYNGRTSGLKYLLPNYLFMALPLLLVSVLAIWPLSHVAMSQRCSIFTGRKCEAVISSAKRVAEVLVKTYRPLGVLTFQTDGVSSGQEEPHFNSHVVPERSPAIGGGPPQLATFDGAGRARDSSHDTGEDA
jgi:hypothetical protein